MLPSNVGQSIYQADNTDRLMGSPRWRGLVFWIKNEIDDDGGKANASIDQFVETVVDRGSFAPVTGRRS